jgi:trimeric autotransporter adhesin
MVAALFVTVSCSEKKKQYLPFSGTGGSPATETGASTNVTGATLSQISVSPADQSIAKDTHATYVATGIYSDGTIKDISNECTWSVKSETDKASTVSSKKGRFLGTAATVSGSPAKVSASFESLSGNANLNITTATLASIQITTIPSLVPGGTAQYVATGIFSDGTTQDISSLVTWSSNNTSSVAVDATTGLGTGGSSAGTATITATLTSPATFPTVANGGVATTTTDLKNVTVVSITVTGSSTVSSGSTNNYVASAIYSDGTSSDITTQATWSLSSNSNASINDNTGSKGILTAISAGNVNVQATYIGITGTKAVTISSLTVTSVAVSPSTKSIVQGTSTQFTATATYSDGSTRDVSNSAVWSSSNTSIAGVTTSTSTGGAAQGISAGSSTITATIGGKSGTATLTVTAATLQSIAINANATIAKGTTKQYTATGTYSDASTQDITSLVSWTTSASNIVSISNASGTKGLATGTAQGSSTIQASLSGINSNTSTLTVTAATLNSIAINASASIENGATKQYSATGTFSDASTQDITSLVTWNSGTSATATISNAVSDKGKAYALALGTTNITATLPNGTNGIATNGNATITSNTSVLTVTAPATATTSNSTVAGYNVTVPSGMTTGTTPTGDFNGITYQGNPAEVAGFVSTVQYSGTAGCTNFGATLLSAMINDTPDKITTNNQISSNTVGTNPDCSVSYNLAVTVNANMTVTELSNHLMEEIGKAVPGGTISNLPVSAGSESATTTFRVILQATYSSTGNELVGVGVSREADYANNAALLNSLLDGTNINPTGSTNTAKTDSFTATADPKVDFVWVVDNSGSMAQEQATVGNNATTFFTKLSTKHLDFRLGVIATGTDGANECSTTYSSHGGNLGWALWGTSQDSSRWVYKNDTNASTTFQSNVLSVGTGGCGTETSIFHAQRALGYGPSPVAATITPRSGAKLIFVALTDEGEFYSGLDSTWNGKGSQAAYIADNIFLTNNYRWYAIMGLNASNQPGACTSGALAGQSNSGTNTALYELVNATGGSAATICATDYSAILDNIATQAAGSASAYTLTKVPVSSTIVVKVNGSTVTQDATNGWQYNATNQSIVFSGSAWPTEGATISVSYEYNSSAQVAFMEKMKDNNLMAYISKTAKSDTARGAAAAIAILVGAILAGRIWSNRKKA